MDSEKCSLRRRRKTTELFAAAVLGTALAAPGLAETEPPAVAALHRFLERVDTLTAEFEQSLYDAEGELVEEASGSFALRRPGHFVWNYRTPIEQVVLADGESIWMYDVELEQATVSPLEEGAGSPAMLLSGGTAVLEGFRIESAYAREGRDWVRLIPELEGTDFSIVAVGFGDDGLPRELELVDGLDQTTYIEFSDIVVNEPLDDSTFELDLPRNVDVIGSAG